MSKIIFGEVDWNDADVNEGGKTQFMKLEQGTSKFRIMGNPVQFYTHWVETKDGKKSKINSPVSSPELLQKLEDAGFKRKPRWVLKVLDRSDDEFKILEIGPQIYNGIKTYYNDPEWGKVTRYDIKVIRAKAGVQPLYTVAPSPKSALDDSFREQYIEFDGGLNLERLIQPSDPKYVCDLLGWNLPGDAQAADDDFAGNKNDDKDNDYPFDFE